MARRRPTASCARCGRRFEPCRYNAHHQNYCTDVSCVTERRRQRQRDLYRKRYRHNELFRQAEQARCREAISRRRSATAESTVTTPPENPAARLNIELFTAGLLAQMIGSNDLEEVRGAAQALQQRGRRLAVTAQSTRGSPW